MNGNAIEKLKYIAYVIRKNFSILGLYIIIQIIPYDMIGYYYNDFPLIYDSWFLTARIFFTIHALFLFYSDIRTHFIYDEREASKYLGASVEDSFVSNAKYFLKRKTLWGGLISLFILLYLLPSNYGIAPMVHLVYGENIFGLKKLLFLLLLFPVYLLIAISARYSAAKNYRKHVDLTKKQRWSSEIYLLVVLTVSYLGGGVFIGYLLPTLLSYAPIAKTVLTSGAAIAVYVILIFVIACKYVNGIIKRKRTLKKIQKTAKELGYRMSEIKYPIKSLFTPVDGESFNLCRGEKLYSCKLISGFKKSHLLIFAENGTGYYKKTLKILRAKLGDRITHFTYDYKAEGYKILIINPTPKKVFKSIEGHLYPIDNGDTACGYKIFTANSFINALERDCIER